jgi:hypothetical protein
MIQTLPATDPSRFRNPEINCGGFVHATSIRNQFTTLAEAWALAKGIVYTVRELVPVLLEKKQRKSPPTRRTSLSR